MDVRATLHEIALFNKLLTSTVDALNELVKSALAPDLW